MESDQRDTSLLTVVVVSGQTDDHSRRINFRRLALLTYGDLFFMALIRSQLPS
jgi:hypothetical protein